MNYNVVGFEFEASKTFRNDPSSKVIYNKEENCLEIKLSDILEKMPKFKIKKNGIALVPKETTHIYQIFLPDQHSDICLKKEGNHFEQSHYDFFCMTNDKLLKVLI